MSDSIRPSDPRFVRAACAAALAAALVVAACSRSEEAPPAAPPAPAAPAAPLAAEPAAPAPAAEPASATPDVAQGERLYATYCASCHGPRGDGDGPAAAALDPKPAKHHDGAYMNALGNEHLFRVIKLGGPAVGKSALMAPWGGTLSDSQIWDVVAFVRSLAEPPYPGSVP
jgi:mono/diheme cytochrome c family protein